MSYQIAKTCLIALSYIAIVALVFAIEIVSIDLMQSKPITQVCAL